MNEKRTRWAAGRVRQDSHEAIRRLRAHCSQNALRFTEERVEVLRAILKVGGHFDPDELLESIRRRGARLGRATLYRTLRVLQDAGIIDQALPGHRHRHYEYVLGKPAHDHIVDTKTGQVIEFESAEVASLCQAICRRHNLRVIGHRLQICAEAAKAINGRKKSAT